MLDTLRSPALKRLAATLMVAATVSLSFPFPLFAYDSKGRVTDVYKLQKVVTGTPTYVRSQSLYGSDGSPAYGNAVEVVEDYGGIGRTTETLEFHVSGKATETQDALGRTFETVYDGDGNVLSVTRTDTTPDVTIATYTYGTTADTVENGQVTNVVDGLSGVEQSISYMQSGVAVGMPESVLEENGSDEYTVSYGYSDLGDREFATYETDSGTVRWHYKDYVARGVGGGASRVFTRLNRMEWTGSAWVESSEEFAYEYDVLGRLRIAAFAQTPRSGEDDYEDLTADTRALAAYFYDPGGRLLQLMYWWQDWSDPGGYATTKMFGTTAAYSHPLALKTSTTFWEEDSGDWSEVRTEHYEYDAQTDWLTEVDYNDGLSNEVTTWTYDAAGNRVSDSSASGSWTYDNLNRMTASPHGGYTNDLLGNRTLWDTSGDDPGYEWDVLNRLTKFQSAVTWPREYYFAYQYRADGMRTKKTNAWASPTEVTRYMYDGQMGIEDYWTDGTDELVTRYGIGARGIEMISKDDGSGEVFGFPVYDTHGNMLATLARSGSSYTLGNEQTYDVWGGVRSGSSSEEQGYVANLGHRSDPESFLTYMRARYYEPHTGRFISEDPARSGWNWFVYTDNAPTSKHDLHGLTVTPALIEILKMIIFRDVLSAGSTAEARRILHEAIDAIIAELEIQYEAALAERQVIMDQIAGLAFDPRISNEEFLAKLETLTGRLNANSGRLGVLKVSMATLKVFMKTMDQLIGLFEFL